MCGSHKMKVIIIIIEYCKFSHVHVMKVSQLYGGIESLVMHIVKVYLIMQILQKLHHPSLYKLYHLFNATNRSNPYVLCSQITITIPSCNKKFACAHEGLIKMCE